MCAEPTSSETLLRIAPDPTWAGQLKNKGTRVVSIDRLKLYKNAKAVRAPECEDALDMDDDEFAENIGLAATATPRDTSTGAGSSGAGGGYDHPDHAGLAGDLNAGETRPRTPAGSTPGSWRATPRKSSSSSTSYSSDSSSTSQNTEKDLLDGTTASEVPGESFLLTPPRFEFNEPHVDAAVPMDTTTPGPPTTTATPARHPGPDPGPSTGAIRKRSHGATPFGTKGVVRRSDSGTPTLDQSVVIPVEGIPQEYLDKYSRVFRMPRVPAKKFIQEEEVALPGYDTKMEEDPTEPPTPPDNLRKDPTYKP